MQGIFNAADIGSQIREKRLAQGMNQTVLAKKLGCSRKWVSDIEQGNETAEIGRVLRALTVLGIKIFVGQSEAVKSKDLSPQYKEILAHRDRFGGVPQGMDRMSKLGIVGNSVKENLDRMSKLGIVGNSAKETLDRMSKLGVIKDPLTKSFSEKPIGSNLLPTLLPPEASKDEGQPWAATTEEASATKPQRPKPGDGKDD
ncbi:helix-turn-helix transcriptional regulator (plasmid) [Gluconobacter sphaericus]|uniref:helix-turn-helix domain-containing protein n=1 Tax=Gluconobacter sphaericus TaxID=574987 RepID=UPI001922C73B|nr:helix-turn-helix domain-containing protein [Gluconobacter sphaericus]QQX92734.1 helix-turn-helix transcriptional regulator [Gluconobacter sphaericus]